MNILIVLGSIKMFFFPLALSLHTNGFLNWKVFVEIMLEFCSCSVLSFHWRQLCVHKGSEMNLKTKNKNTKIASQTRWGSNMEVHFCIYHRKFCRNHSYFQAHTQTSGNVITIPSLMSIVLLVSLRFSITDQCPINSILLLSIVNFLPI